jgi:alkylation response protein AidB-like acyl-CoA dehydrogenase
MNRDEEVFFDDMRIPAANLLGEEGKGFRYILSALVSESLTLPSASATRSGSQDRRRIRQQPDGLRPEDRREPGRRLPVATAFAHMRAAG